MTADALPELIRLLHADLAGPAPWLRFLDALGAALPCDDPTIVTRAPRQGDPGTLLTPDGDPPGARPYRETLFDATPFRAIQPGVVHALHGMFAPDALAALPYYSDYLAPAGVIDLFALDLVAARSGFRLRLRGSRRAGAAPFARPALELVRRLAPHLQTALDLHIALTERQTRLDLYERSADALGIGAALVAESGAPIFANPVLRAMLGRGGALVLRNGRLHGTDGADDRRLQAAMRAIAAGGHPQAPIHLLLADPADGGRWSVLIQPVGDWAAADAGALPAAMLLVRAPGLFRPIPAAHLARVFQLTPAEIALTRHLIEGRSIDEAAAANGIARNTARNQLAAIFAKTGVNRQAELVRLVLETGVNLWPEADAGVVQTDQAPPGHVG